tara:strand:+ start:51 stop:533 length:483 start_codon:yes stop_codon:yes gene_type:complete
MILCNKIIKLLVYDFDGVMTDNKALIFPNGDEAVFINRSDGLAIKKIKSLNLQQLIISSEKNNIVQKRAQKLNIPAINGIDNKLNQLKKYIKINNIKIDNVAFIGNDINDLEVMTEVGICISPADAVEEILKISDFITHAKGGSGVIREIYKKIYEENPC